MAVDLPVQQHHFNYKNITVGGQERAAERGAVRDVVYRFSVLSLASHIMHVDGELTKEERVALPVIFSDIAEESKELFSLVIQAFHDRSPAKHYASSLLKFFGDEKHVLNDIIERLTRLSLVDGALVRQELELLYALADMWGIDRAVVVKHVASDVLPEGKNAFAIFNMPRRQPLSLYTKAYHRLMREYHPDKFSFLPDSDPFMALLHERAHILNRAYEEIEKKYR